MSDTTGDPCSNPDCGRGYDDCTKTVLRKKAPHACCSECAYTDTHNVRQAPTSTDPTWLHAAVEAGARAMYQRSDTVGRWCDVPQHSVPRDLWLRLSRAAILAALPAITGGVADAIESNCDGATEEYGACADCQPIIDLARAFGSEVTR